MRYNGKPRSISINTDSDKPVPEFIPEILATKSILSIGGPLWKKTNRWKRLRDCHTIHYNVPITKELETFIEEHTTLLNEDMSIVLNKGYREIEKYHMLDKGWQLSYSGGKESALGYSILNELGEKVCLTSSTHEKTVYYPDVPINRVQVNPWQVNGCIVATTVANAVQNNVNSAVLGYELNYQYGRNHSYYSGCNNTLLEVMNNYLKNFCNVKLTSIVCQLPGILVQGLLFKRYPNFQQTYTPAYGRPYQRLLHLFWGQSFPKTWDKKSGLSTFRHQGLVVGMYLLEIEHMFAKLKGHPLFKNNPQQNAPLHPWLEKYNGNVQPISAPKGLESIYKEHFEVDYEDHSAEINKKDDVER